MLTLFIQCVCLFVQAVNVSMFIAVFSQLWHWVSAKDGVLFSGALIHRPTALHCRGSLRPLPVPRAPASGHPAVPYQGVSGHPSLESWPMEQST